MSIIIRTSVFASQAQDAFGEHITRTKHNGHKDNEEYSELKKGNDKKVKFGPNDKGNYIDVIEELNEKDHVKCGNKTDCDHVDSDEDENMLKTVVSSKGKYVSYLLQRNISSKFI